MNAAAKDTLNAVLVVVWALFKIVCSMIWALFTGVLKAAEEAEPVVVGQVDDEQYWRPGSPYYRGPR
ncbi:hypothetical protein [Deinococcus aquaedulcis]|uniref:hypothetical protein n=1 Tax=Deinococcus aquaedulcis TaxID=2840455 RepID=UPI001C83B5DA|nr:hypothetical protein [Deinococcus aquaedulcis]